MQRLSQRKEERAEDFAFRLIKESKLCVPPLTDPIVAGIFLAGVTSLQPETLRRVKAHKERKGEGACWQSCQEIMTYLKQHYRMELATTPASSASAARIEARADDERKESRSSGKKEEGKKDRKDRRDSDSSDWTEARSKKRGRGRSRGRDERRSESQGKRSRSRSAAGRGPKDRRTDSRQRRNNKGNERYKKAFLRNKQLKEAEQQGFKEPFSADMLPGKVELLSEEIMCGNVKIRAIKHKESGAWTWFAVEGGKRLRPREQWPNRKFFVCCGRLGQLDEVHPLSRCSKPASKALQDLLTAQLPSN